MTQQILEYPRPRRPSQLCSIVYLRCALFGFTTVLLLSGLFLLGFGVYAFITELHIAPLLPLLYVTSVYALIAVGALVLLTAIIGCYGTIQEQHQSLYAYSVLLVVIFILELAAGALSYYVYAQLNSPQGSLSSHVTQLMSDSWGKDELVTNTLDELQLEYQCCGVNYHTDWMNNSVLQSSEMKVPDSCCISPVPKCGKLTHVSNLHQRGCGGILIDSVHIVTIAIPALTLGFSVMQIIGVIFSCALARQTCRSRKLIRLRTYRY